MGNTNNKPGTNEELAYRINNEGIGYTIQNYPIDFIENEEIKEQWIIALNAINRINKILSPLLED